MCSAVFVESSRLASSGQALDFTPSTISRTRLMQSQPCHCCANPVLPGGLRSRKRGVLVKRENPQYQDPEPASNSLPLPLLEAIEQTEIQDVRHIPLYILSILIPYLIAF